MIRWLDRGGAAATLLLPLFLLHGRGIAEALLLLLGAGLLLRSAAERDWSWLRLGWVRAALAWWAWLVLCTAVSGPERLGQAVGVVRFPLLVAALQHWTLRNAALRHWLARLLRWAAFYIALQCAVQFVAGRNLFGMPRGADGELTGPYQNPRAGAPLSRLLFPALLPLASGPLAGLLLLAGGIGAMVMVGQRMPLLLSLLGLFATALLLPRLRMPVLWAAGATALLLVALPALSPQAAARLETKFTDQMAHFPSSHYGLIAARATAITAAHPVTGAGFDGFRVLCEAPRYFHGWFGDDGGGAAICVQHPHNFVLQAMVEAGVPGLVLFAVMAGAWLRALGRGLWRDATPLRAGLFVAAVIHLWPLASTTAFTSMPLSGWFFVLLGLGLAEADAYMPGQRLSEDHHV